MQISINWIKDFVNLDGIEVEELVKRFNLSTAEIEEVIYKGKDTENVVLAKILEVENHPQSQKLHILKVDDGTGEPVQVVCGAPNVRVGLVTAFARVGGKVSGQKISKAKLAGVESFGMCCGENELGIGSDESGIVELEEVAPLGTDIKQIFPIEDVVFEVDNKSLTNRPDLWGHYGIAREFAAIFGRELKPLEVIDTKQYDNLPKLDIKVENKDCFRYSSITVKNVTEKKSPMNVKIRLNYCGLRDINLLADLTNYLMLEVGQPMHSFDNEVVKGIIVADPKEKVKMLTLEGEEHIVEPGSMLICDNNREPVAVAGIKGGLKSGISESTNSLLLESAVFDATNIRKTSQKVGLKTDASMRYEKSLDPETTIVSIERYLKLLKDIDPKVEVSSALTDVYNYHYPQREIVITSEFISRRGGVKLEEERVIDILQRLQFKVEKKGEELHISVPSWRATKDVSIKEDIVEEVFRMYGYDNIKPESINFPLEPVEQAKRHTIEYKAKRLLAEKYGVNEVHSHIWNFTEFNKSLGFEIPSYISLVDSSNSQQSGIRSELAPTLIKFMCDNKNNYPEIKICEIGRVVDGLDENNIAIESHKLAIVNASNRKTEEELLFEVKQMLENIASSLVQTTLEFAEGEYSKYYHPVNSYKVKTDLGEIGTIGLLHPSVKTKIDKKWNVAVVEVDFTKFTSSKVNERAKVVVSKYQTVSQDYNFLVPKEMKYAEIKTLLDAFKSNYIVSYSLKDIYENAEQLGDKISYTFSYQITPKDKTLETEEIEKFTARLLRHVGTAGIVLR